MQTKQKYSTLFFFCLVSFMDCLAAGPASTQLAQLIKTNAPCRVRLQPAWTGATERTVATGFFTNESRQHEKFHRELQFDWFMHSDKPSGLNYGSRTISRSAGGEGVMAIHAHCAGLPSDAAIQGCKTIKALTNLLGPSQGFRDGAPLGANWSFFTFTPTNSIVTLSVFSIRDRLDGEINSLEIRRGAATEKR